MKINERFQLPKIYSDADISLETLAGQLYEESFAAYQIK